MKLFLRLFALKISGSSEIFITLYWGLSTACYLDPTGELIFFLLQDFDVWQYLLWKKTDGLGSGSLKGLFCRQSTDLYKGSSLPNCWSVFYGVISLILIKSSSAWCSWSTGVRLPECILCLDSDNIIINIFIYERSITSYEF